VNQYGPNTLYTVGMESFTSFMVQKTQVSWTEIHNETSAQVTERAHLLGTGVIIHSRHSPL